jgi:ABC-type glycerol-3-phosphate transport system substrate-binding protein
MTDPIHESHLVGSTDRGTFLRRAGAAGAGLAAMGAMSTAAASAAVGRARGARASSTTLTVQWFGDQDGPGLKNWFADRIRAYQHANPSIKIKATLLAPAAVIDGMNAEGLAHSGPDIHYQFGPIWTLEQVWAGHAVPLDSYWSKAQIAALGPIAKMVSFKGKTWQSCWYGNTQGMVYNKKLLAQAGVDASKPLATWADFLAACAKLKTAGIQPIGIGAKDGFIGEWLFGFVGRQNANNLKEMLRPVLGLEKYTDPKWNEYLFRVDDLLQAGYINNDATSLDLYQGQSLFSSGKAAFTWAVSGQMVAFIKQMGGSSVVGIMPTPVFGKGKYAGSFSLGGPHGFMIPSWSKHKPEAAKFLAYLHASKNLTAMYRKSGLIPTDPAFKPSVITEPSVQGMVAAQKKNGLIAGMNTVVPNRVIQDGADSGIQGLLAGTAPADIAAKIEQAAELWRSQATAELANYKTWYQTL